MKRAWVFGLAFGLGVGCAGRKDRSRNPESCATQCERRECDYDLDGLGDNDAYYDCMDKCIKNCGG